MKFLAIDIGNVICNVSFEAFINKLSKTINVSTDDVNYFLNRTQKLHDIGLTVISDELRDHFKIKSSALIDELMVEWNKTVSTNTYMVSVLRELIHEDNVKIALLSNIGLEHAAIMPELLTKDVHDPAVKFFSCHVGSRKPSHLYYKTFLDMYPEFKGCLYLDDRPENIATGANFGLNVRHFALDSFKSEIEISVGVNFLRKRFK